MLGYVRKLLLTAQGFDVTLHHVMWRHCIMFQSRLLTSVFEVIVRQDTVYCKTRVTANLLGWGNFEFLPEAMFF